LFRLGSFCERRLPHSFSVSSLTLLLPLPRSLLGFALVFSVGYDGSPPPFDSRVSPCLERFKHGVFQPLLSSRFFLALPRFPSMLLCPSHNLSWVFYSLLLVAIPPGDFPRVPRFHPPPVHCLPPFFPVLLFFPPPTFKFLRILFFVLSPLVLSPIFWPPPLTSTCIVGAMLSVVEAF